jgi:hypothetical protein
MNHNGYERKRSDATYVEVKGNEIAIGEPVAKIPTAIPHRRW